MRGTRLLFLRTTASWERPFISLSLSFHSYKSRNYPFLLVPYKSNEMFVEMLENTLQIQTIPFFPQRSYDKCSHSAKDY